MILNFVRLHKTEESTRSAIRNFRIYKVGLVVKVVGREG